MQMRNAKLSAGVLAIALAAGVLAGQQNSVEMRLRRDLAFLASKECEGRGVETKGLELAAKYIAAEFKKAGLKPGGKMGWYQPFKISGPAKLNPGSRIVLHGPQGQTIELKENTHFKVMGYSGKGKVTAPVVFTGYGVTAKDLDYDDYGDVDAKGKVVILIRRLPRWNNKYAPFGGPQKQQLAALVNKTANAELHNAAAVVMVNDHGIRGDALLRFRDLARGISAGSIPAMHVKRDVVDGLLRSSLGRSLRETEAAIERELQPQSAELKGWKATIEAKVQRKIISVKNVVGVLEGSGSLKDEIIVVGAHYDHLGYGERGSLAKPADRKKIHFGADDNASGTTTVLELARRFGKMKNRKGRKLVFMTFSAEEKGLLGSRHYCNKEPLFPLADTAAMVNLDMVGRMQTDPKTKKGVLRAQGVGTAKGFESLVDNLNKKYNFALRKIKGGTGPSDHDSFYRKKIPVFFFWTGTHKDYHRPTDTFDRINYKDMARIADLTEDVIQHLTTANRRPQYVQVKGGSGVRPVGNIPKLGIRPAYDENKKGLLVDSVVAGGAAEKGGMKDGDLIIAINKQTITNIRTYMLQMSRQKRGRPIPITVRRGKKEVTLKIAPQ